MNLTYDGFKADANEVYNEIWRDRNGPGAVLLGRVSRKHNAAQWFVITYTGKGGSAVELKSGDTFLQVHTWAMRNL